MVSAALLVASARGDTLVLGSANSPPSSTVLVPLDLVKINPVVAVQFELRYPTSHVASGVPVIHASTDHQVESSDPALGVQRIVVYSRTNAVLPADLRLQLPLSLGTNSPAGGPSAALANILFTDAQGSSFPAGVIYTFLEQWRRTHFNENERANPTLIGDDRDPDGDGIINLLELASGGGPKIPDAPQASGGELFVDGQNRVFLTLRFLRTKDPGAQAALNWEGQSSPDLTQWTNAGVTLVPTGAGDSVADELEARVEVTGQPQRFLRVTVRRQPGQ